jgi:hypothetical protein
MEGLNITSAVIRITFGEFVRNLLFCNTIKRLYRGDNSLFEVRENF